MKIANGKSKIEIKSHGELNVVCKVVVKMEFKKSKINDIIGMRLIYYTRWYILMKISNKKTWIGIFILIAIEQLIKIIINNSYLYKTYPILPPYLYFQPMFNRDYSWVNSMLQLGISKWLHIVMVAIITILLVLFYQFLNKRLGSRKEINLMFAFIFSGAICSLIDKVLWDGSLDYIYVRGFFTFDLKDVYINVFLGLLVLFALLKNKTLKEIDDNDLLTGFLKYIIRGQ